MKKMFLMAVIITAVLASCKKDSTPDPICRIITITTVSSGATTATNSFTYNSDGKISTSSDGTSIVTFVYSGSTEISTTTKGGVFVSKNIATLNANGQTSNFRTETDALGTKWNNEAFEYNGTDIIKSTYTSSAGGATSINTLTWNGGNLVSASDGSTTTTVEYYPDIQAQTGDYFDIAQIEAGYRIYKTKNAVKSISSGSTISNFSYSFDAGGKIISMIITSTSAITYNYQYQCNVSQKL
jgi:hypothetical protein